MKMITWRLWGLVALVLATAVSSASANNNKGIKGMKVSALPPAQAPKNEDELLAHAPTVMNIVRKLQHSPTKMPPNGASINSIKINGQAVTHNGIVPGPAPVDCSRYGTAVINGVSGGKGKGGKGGGVGRGSRFSSSKGKGGSVVSGGRYGPGIPAECLRQPGFVSSVAGGKGKGGKGKNGKLGRGGSIIPVQQGYWNGRFSGNGRAVGEGGEDGSQQQQPQGSEATTTSTTEAINLVETEENADASSAVYTMATATIVAACVALFVVL